MKLLALNDKTMRSSWHEDYWKCSFFGSGDIRWWFDVALFISASQFLHKRPQSNLFVCRPSFLLIHLPRMISCDNLMAIIAVDVKFERQMAQGIHFYLNFLSYSDFAQTQIPQPKKVWRGWWLWERADSTDCAKLKNPFVCNLKPRWRVVAN